MKQVQQEVLKCFRIYLKRASEAGLRVSELLQMSLPAVPSALVFLLPLSCLTDNGLKMESWEQQ